MARNTLNPAQVAQYLGRKSAKRIANAHARSTLAQGPHSIWRMYSLLQRTKSLRHGLWYGVSERIQWSRGAFLETPARELCTVNLGQSERIAALRDRYQVQFELRMSAATSFNNYEYLDILDHGWRGLGMSRPAGGVLCDIGYTDRLCGRLFRQIQRNLRPDGLYFMVNHGLQEAALAENWCNAAELRCVGRWSEPGALSRHRPLPPVLSWWTQA